MPISQGPTSLGRLASRRTVVVLVVAAAAVLLASAGRPWVSAVLPQVPGRPEVFLSGRAAAPGAIALGVVALAGAVVVATATRAVLRVTAALLAVAGAVVAVTCVLAVADPARAVASSAARAAGVSDPVLAAVTTTAWPLIAALAGGVLAVAGVLTWVQAPRWTTAGPTGAQDDATTEGTAPSTLDTWDALSRGEDPT